MRYIPEWLLPTVGFILMLAVQGITIKLALRHVHWLTILGWTSIVYGMLLGVLTVTGSIRFVFVESKLGTLFAILSGVAAAGGFVLMNVALSRGKATEVVPVGAAYPVVSAVLGVLILGESLSRFRMLGILIVVSGLVILGASSD